MIFGTVYLYEMKNGEFDLFNGIPIRFESGVGEFLVPILRQIFDNKKEQRKVEPQYIKGIKHEMLKNGAESRAEDYRVVSVGTKENGAGAFFTEESNPAHPAAIFLRLSPYNTSMEYRLLYSNDREKSQQWFKEIVSSLEEYSNVYEKELLRFIDRKNK